MSNKMLTIQQIQSIAGRLRKYRITHADAKAISEALVHSVDGPLPVRAEDLASLMRPRRPAPERDVEAEHRRRLMRERLIIRGPEEFLFQHDAADLPALKSAVQYRARKAGLTWTVTVVDPTHALVTLGE